MSYIIFLIVHIQSICFHYQSISSVVHPWLEWIVHSIDDLSILTRNGQSISASFVDLWILSILRTCHGPINSNMEWIVHFWSKSLLVWIVHGFMTSTWFSPLWLFNFLFSLYLIHFIIQWYLVVHGLFHWWCQMSL